MNDFFMCFVCVVAVVAAAAAVLGFVDGSESLYTGDLVSCSTFYSLTVRVRI